MIATGHNLNSLYSKLLLLYMSLCILSCSCSNPNKYAGLQAALTEYVADKDANVGIGVIVDGKDTIAINGNRQFPMLSVYKFPIALALADHYQRNSLPIDKPVKVTKDDLHIDTYSPMTEKIIASSCLVADSLMVQTLDLLAYMLQQSDNNASDIVLRKIGGVKKVEAYLQGIGISGVNVKNTENEMHADNTLCYSNSASPLSMAQLMDKFDREFNDSASVVIKRLMESCETGSGRLAKPFEPTNVVIGHKTGTGFTLSDGRLMAVNDAGYVHLPDGRRYTIVVFIENSGYDMAQTEAMIADISRMVWTGISGW